MNRLDAGYCKMTNPYSHQVYRVELTPEYVDGFVFWTKNIGPFLQHLPEIRRRGYPFIVQHTINGYPRQLEFKVTDYVQTVEHMRILSDEYGPNVAIWRYDPIIISSLTPLDWHQHNFEHLAAALEGTTNEVVVSFAQIYKKTRRNMNQAATEFGFQWNDHEAISNESIRNLITIFAQIAKSHGMQLRICAQKALLIPGVTEEARCVDADRIEKVSNKPIPNKSKQQGNRKECGCFASKDIGEYDTCPHGCVYCYAVQNRDLALQRYKAHEPESEFLFAPKGYAPPENEEIKSPQIIPLAKISKKDGISRVVQEKLFE